MSGDFVTGDDPGQIFSVNFKGWTSIVRQVATERCQFKSDHRRRSSAVSVLSS